MSTRMFRSIVSFVLRPAGSAPSSLLLSSTSIFRLPIIIHYPPHFAQPSRLQTYTYSTTTGPLTTSAPRSQQTSTNSPPSAPPHTAENWPPAQTIPTIPSYSSPLVPPSYPTATGAAELPPPPPAPQADPSTSSSIPPSTSTPFADDISFSTTSEFDPPPSPSPSPMTPDNPTPTLTKGSSITPRSGLKFTELDIPPIPQTVRAPPRLGSRAGKSISVIAGDLTGAIMGLRRLCSENNIAGDSRNQRFHERPGEKRKRQKRERFRRRFKESFKRMIDTVLEMKRQGI